MRNFLECGVKYVLANLKSYALDVLPYVNYLEQNLDPRLAPFITLFPPLLCLEKFSSSQCFQLGVQNAYPALEGAFTGEITLKALQNQKIETVLIGHSERRLLLKESLEMCRAKFEFYKDQGFKIVFCIGESLEVRQKGIEALLEFLTNQLAGIDVSYPKLILAYEPIWAIGTGISAQTKEIEQTLERLKGVLKSTRGVTPFIVYGGSVQVDNVEEILNLSSVDGVLIGKASLKAKDLLEIIKISSTKEFA
nr:triose-phosphate isomerase [Helicobacter suis]